jgi:hypothetical protein
VLDRGPSFENQICSYANEVLDGLVVSPRHDTPFWSPVFEIGANGRPPRSFEFKQPIRALVTKVALTWNKF